MKILAAFFGFALLAACNHSGNSTRAGDTTTINTKTNSPADGGPNNGLGDSNTYNRGNDTLVHDSASKVTSH